MCLISIAGKGTEKYSDFFLESLQQGMKIHRDGSGFAYKIAKTGSIYFHKGFKNFDALLSALKAMNIKSEDELIVHSRTCSAGSVSDMNTHPFMLTPNTDIPTTIGPVTSRFPIMFHNGTFTEFKKVTSAVSDSYTFANSFMKHSDVWQMFIQDRSKFDYYFKELIGINKLAFLCVSHDVQLVGDFTSDRGYMFSNASYKVASSNNTVNQDRQLTIIKNDEPLTINTVKINLENYDQFLVKALDDIKGDFGKILKYSVLYIRKYNIPDKSVLLEYRDNKSTYVIGVPMELLDNKFGLIPLAEYRSIYQDLIRLHMNFKGTKSAVKKVYNKFRCHIGRKRMSDKIQLKSGNNKNTYNIEAVRLFINDYVNYLSKSEVDNINDYCKKLKLVV